MVVLASGVKKSKGIDRREHHERKIAQRGEVQESLVVHARKFLK
jgi:hypothetical protein